MNENGFGRMVSQIILVASVCVFSIALIVFNILSEWENWIIPLFLLSGLSCIMIHILEKPSESNRVYIYAGILIGELFYYCVHVHIVFNAAPVIMIIASLFVLRREEKLVLMTLIMGYIGITYNILAKYSTGDISLSRTEVLSLCWHFVLLFFTALVFHVALAIIKKNVDATDERYRRLKEANERTEMLLARASQEFLASVLALRTQSELIVNKSANEDMRRDMESLMLTQNILESRIEEVYDYSQIKKNQVSVTVENASVPGMLSDLRRELVAYQKPQVVLEMNCDPAVSSYINTDITKIKKILRHLVINAFEHTDEGGIYVSISQYTRPYGINLILVVEDTGTGLDDEGLKSLEKHYSMEDPVIMESEGLGLGVSIVAGLTHALGGFVSVFSSPAAGTKIRVTIPLYDSDRYTFNNPAIDLAQKLYEQLGGMGDEEPQTAHAFSLDIQKGIRYCADDETLYHNQLERFVGDVKKRLNEAEGYISSGDIDNYRIVAHSIKGTAKMIGAVELSDKAKELEDAAKKNDIDFIISHNDELVYESDRVITDIESMDLEGKDSKSAEDESDIGFIFYPYDSNAANIKK